MTVCRLLVLLCAATAACSQKAARAPAEFARLEAPARDPCEVVGDADFEGAGAAELHRYVAWLARTYGGAVQLAPRDVSLAIVKGVPKPTLTGVVAGEVACGDNRHNPPYRIAIYRDALAGRQRFVVYRTVAHEFQHVVQIRRDRLPCSPPKRTRERYEREAAAAADRLVPAC